MKFSKSESGETGVCLAFHLPDKRKLEHTFCQQDDTKVYSYNVLLFNNHVLASVINI